MTAGEAEVAAGAGPSRHTRGLLGCGGENRQLGFQVTAAGGLGCEAGGPGFVLSQEIFPTFLLGTSHQELVMSSCSFLQSTSI